VRRAARTSTRRDERSGSPAGRGTSLRRSRATPAPFKRCGRPWLARLCKAAATPFWGVACAMKGWTFVMRMRRRVGSAVLGTVLVGAAVLVAVGPASPAAADGGSIVYGWGSNDDGAVGIGTAGEPQVRPMPVVGQAPDVVQVTGGYQYSVALHADGTVWTWGDNEF